ncbi:MAG: M23 family metallopeptidase [Proteobacteria bacterium]|nr:M23 family metallopeptidase [Pseudomonadota bacterium]
MVNTKITDFEKKMPPIKTGQRFGERTSNKKLGLFSERRFLIFTKKGPIEITFKPIHYTGAIMTAIVGITSIVYWSAMGIYSAIDVANKQDLIAQASANVPDLIENDYDTKENILNKGETNITIAIDNLNSIDIKNETLTNEILKSIELETVNNKVNNEESVLNTEKEINNLANTNPEILTNDDLIKDKKISEINNNDEFDSFYNDKTIDKLSVFPKAPIINDKVKNFRFIASVDNELLTMEKVFKLLNVNIEGKNDKLKNVTSLIENSSNIDPDSNLFFTSLKERLNLLAIYKNALQFIPLKPPMEHYYISSQYGKRKHPVTGKYRIHHGIDLAGTWQEKISVSADGTVVFAGYHGTFGKVIRIKHRYGIVTTYGHLAKINVKMGDIVSEGQTIGKMGRTGRVDGAHLHYEISVNGKSQNPNSYIKVGRNLLSRTSLKEIVEVK